MNRKAHWESVYASKSPDAVSWYQQHPTVSLQLILNTGITHEDAIIDVGCGESLLAEHLLDAGYQNLTLLDISGEALKVLCVRLKSRSGLVTCIEADVTEFEPPKQYALWHDRAVFHFLTEAEDRQKYLARLKLGLNENGHLIMGAFAMDGPERCSGLEVVRYDAKRLSAELGPEFKLVEQASEQHMTPWHTEQRFGWFRFERK